MTRSLTPPDGRSLRIANCSGFYGDRLAAMREMVDYGEVDVITGDYLAELTMLILARGRLKDPDAGYATTFVRQISDCLADAVAKGIRIVANAGGLNPAALAQRIRAIAADRGIAVTVAHIEGDDLTARAVDLGLGTPLTANAYLGAFGIAEALRRGADVVVTGRVTDASLTVGPAIAAFGWGPEDLDALAGATVAGHVIECGTQATGGNYSHFTELPDLLHPGFPIAEVAADGSSVITKAPGTSGAVTVGTVTEQLLYEIGGARYVGPDVTTRIDTARLAQVGPDRVAITGVRGEPAPPTIKVSRNLLGGFYNEMTFVLTGLDIEAKAALLRAQLDDALAAAPPKDVRYTLARTDHPDAADQQTASAVLHVAVRDADPDTVGRFSSAGVELALASYPGFAVTAPPGKGTPYGVFDPGWVERDVIEQVVVIGDRRIAIPSGPAVTPAPVLAPVPEPASVPGPALTAPEPDHDPRIRPDTVRVPLGSLVGARSGDKGGNANVGVWVRVDAAYRWLVDYLTVETVRELLPETAELPIERHLLPNLRAINLVLVGVLGEGVASRARFDPQAKGMGEWLRSRHVDIPRVLLHENRIGTRAADTEEAGR